MKLRVIMACICVLCLNSSAGAHEFLMKPNVQKTKKGTPIVVDMMETHVFIEPEETPVLEDVELFVVQGKGLSESVPLKKEAKEHVLRGKFVVKTDEDIVLLGKRKPQFWSNTTEGILEGNRASLEAQGKKVISADTYEKYALLFIPGNKGCVSSKYAYAGEKPPLVIIPGFNPSCAKVGEKLSFKVLSQGKPFGKAPISITYDGFTKEEGVFVKTKKASKDGYVRFKPTKPGLWIIHTESKEKVMDGSVDERNIRSSTLFWVN